MLVDGLGSYLDYGWLNKLVRAFLYEVLDASFSFDGVIGAFAQHKMIWYWCDVCSFNDHNVVERD